MKKAILLTTAGLLFGLQIEVATAALSDAERALEARDYTSALQELRPLAQEGNAAALNLLGQMYENGWGVEADPEMALRYYEQGARQGDLDSVNSLRALKNKAYKAEFDSLLPKAESGDAVAQNRVGEMYEFGQGVERNGDTAFQWYSRAAEQGNVTAWHNLGRAYNFGTGVAQDYAKAEGVVPQGCRAGLPEGHVLPRHPVCHQPRGRRQPQCGCDRLRLDEQCGPAG